MIQIGDKFGALIVAGEAQSYLDGSGYKRRRRLCKCTCGKEVTVSDASLRSGNTRSCGCLQKRWAKSGNAKRVHAKVLDIPDTDECVEWQGARTKGYGHRIVDNKQKYVHREAWVQANGEIPDGLDVLHRCDNPPCYNPRHLFLGTHADNMRDMIEKERGAFKIPLAQRRTIPQRIARGERGVDLAREFYVTKSNISRLKRAAGL